MVNLPTLKKWVRKVCIWMAGTWNLESSSINHNDRRCYKVLHGTLNSSASAIRDFETPLNVVTKSTPHAIPNVRFKQKKMVGWRIPLNVECRALEFKQLWKWWQMVEHETGVPLGIASVAGFFMICHKFQFYGKDLQVKIEAILPWHAPAE